MLRPLKEADVVPLTDIYNYYVANSEATFETEPLTPQQMRQRLFNPVEAGFPCLVEEEEDKVIGYGALHPFRPRFDYVAEATIYFAPDSLGRGHGAAMLARLIDEGRKLHRLNGIIACINARNEASRALVERFGFRQVGVYERVGRKFGQWLDDVDYELLF